MKRRVVAAVTAVLLAATGGVLLLAYVGAADQRAMADLAPAKVLVLTKAVGEGATSEELSQAVAVRELPGVAVAPGAATSVAELEGLVTTTDLQPGEQLLRSRLADPAVLEAAAGVVVPPGLHQVSVQLEPERVVAGSLAPGATVGVFLSTEDEDATALSLRKVLVTAVTGGSAAPTGDSGDSGDSGGSAAPAAPQPGVGVTVTLALDAASAQKVVFAAEHGSIWLSAEPADAPADQRPVLTKENLYS